MTIERTDLSIGAGATLAGLAFGEASCGLSAGWSGTEAQEFFGRDDVPFEQWPRRARGLPLPIRRILRMSGLHGIQTQMAMACAYADGDSSLDWVVTGFEAGAWRNFPRGLVSMAHRQRVDYTSRLTKDVTVRPGPIGASVAFLNTGDAAERRRATATTLNALYGDDLTTLVGVVFGEILARLISGEVPTFSGVIDDLRGEPEVRTLGLDRLDDVLAVKAGPLSLYGQLIKAIQLALESDAEPDELLGRLLLDGGASETSGAAAGAILAARHGLGWCDTTRLVDERRILECASWLDGASGSKQSVVDFLDAESVLTRQEMAFRDEMMAERRTSPRSS